MAQIRLKACFPSRTAGWLCFLFCLFIPLVNVSAKETSGLLKNTALLEAPTREEVKLQVYAEEPENLAEFFKHRIQFGTGFDEEYNDNLLLQDNKKRDEWISTLESLLLFNDPRGELLYGARYEVNAYRYHRSNNNAIDHDFMVYADYDPGGRIQYHAEYGVEIAHYLLFGDEKIDILRRSSKFQELVQTVWRGKAQYALNTTNHFIPQLIISTLDDHSLSDTNADRKSWDFIADLDHDLTPTWTLFGGYTRNNTLLPKSKTKNSQSQGGRLGVRHALTEIEDLDATFSVQQVEFKDGGASTNMGFVGKWIYQAGPRTKLEFNYSDTQGTSFSVGRRQFRGQSPSVKVQYELTPLTDLTASAGYNLQTSSSQEVAAGGTPIHSEKQTGYGLGLGAEWRFRENGHITLDISHTRSYSRDTTDNRGAVGFEISF